MSEKSVSRIYGLLIALVILAGAAIIGPFAWKAHVEETEAMQAMQRAQSDTRLFDLAETKLRKAGSND